MSSRRSLYYVYCLGSSARQVLGGSWDVGKESLITWINTSTLTRPILSQYQWFYDPEWENARKLAEETRVARHGQRNKRNQPKKAGIRQYSTSTKAPANERHLLKEQQDSEKEKRELQSSEVPSSRLARLFHYGSLAAGVGINVASEGISRVAKGKTPTWRELILSQSNVERITKKFSQMRGAALKVGQIMSFQDDKVLPKELYEVLSRVQNSAHYMPQRQLNKVLVTEFGADWASKFAHFDKIPIAAASIGQVHKAELPTGEKVVVKIQYPGVKDSIDSDLNNIMMILGASRLLPKGLFLDKTIANARRELKWECDYVREAAALRQFEDLLKDDPVFEVPHVYRELTTNNVITMSYMEGTEIMKLPKSTAQDLKDHIAGNILRLCLQEIAVFKCMQTDPNWANFLYNSKTNKIELLDFGASRSFPESFITNYRKLLSYATEQNREMVGKLSKELGYLNGLESQAMIDAHVNSVMILGEPFAGPPDAAFSFKDQTVSDRIRSNIGLMLDERLCPPPEETYSLHRKFSGIFLLCARMEATVFCSKYFHEFFYLV
ncbi:COQ8 (YGL119W) and YBR230W-A [Zygosaccharomyces parabailii]|nr:COQ8 (YGL119W) and YBR230W-A [Zygosaccharomyces parabailii]